MTDPFAKPLSLDELAWLTEQYVLGELDEASCELLEFRFANDQSAREALASSIALLSATAIAGDSRPVTEKATQVAAANWRAYQGWFVGMAVVLLVGAFWAAQSDWFQPVANGSLAKAWAETREVAVSEELEGDLVDAVEAVAFSSDEVEAPDWLVTAINLNQDKATESKGSAASPPVGEGA